MNAEAEVRTVLLVLADPAEAEAAARVLEGAGYAAARARSGGEAVERVYGEPPDLILLDRDLPDGPGAGVCRTLKAENIFSHLPLILVLEAGDRPAWEEVPADDYVVRPLEPAELVSRAALALARTARTLDANPLTRLPGNPGILREVQCRLDRKERFALAYADLDHFKAFNDKYGFQRGDEVLRMTARVLTNAVREAASGRAFVGHVGGDDFVFLLPLEAMKAVCPRILERFDRIVPTFYDEEDRRAGGIRVRDRRGEPRTYPLMTLSIAVVPNGPRIFTHVGEMSSVAAELKKYVKGRAGSNYLVDRRSGAARSEEAGSRTTTLSRSPGSGSSSAP